MVTSATMSACLAEFPRAPRRRGTGCLINPPRSSLRACSAGTRRAPTPTKTETQSEAATASGPSLVVRDQRERNWNACEGEQDPEAAAEHRQQHALGEELPDQAAA